MVRHCSQRENSAHLGVKGLIQLILTDFSVHLIQNKCNVKTFIKFHKHQAICVFPRETIRIQLF